MQRLTCWTVLPKGSSCNSLIIIMYAVKACITYRGGKKPVYKYSSQAKPSPPPSLSPHTWGRRLGCICGRKHRVKKYNINTFLETCKEVSHNIQRPRFLLFLTLRLSGRRVTKRPVTLPVVKEELFSLQDRSFGEDSNTVVSVDHHNWKGNKR